MEAAIKPIETVYKGYRFRSRLEARWAVFFDTIHAQWEYEPEGFMLEDGNMYLPDFLVHNVRGMGAKDKRQGDDIYVEIKGVLDNYDLHKIELFSNHKPIIIFGQIPDYGYTGSYWEDAMVEYKGKIRKAQVLMDGYWYYNFSKDNNEHFYNLEFSKFRDYYWAEPKAGKGGGLVLDYPDDPYDFVDNVLTIEGYSEAKRARFEHGENPGKMSLNVISSM